jgi:hypothetical protein
MKKLIIFVLSLYLFNGCSKQSKTMEQHSTVYGPGLLRLIESAAGGNSEANDSLSQVIDPKLPANSNYNSITIDSIINYNGKRIYLALMEHPIPVFNRFAVFDEKLRCYLIDKSLNGYLKSSVYRSAGEILIQVDENFVSKDELEITRRSLYLLKNDTAALAFRDYMELKNGESNMMQDIASINKDSISTTIKAGGVSENDLFVFNSASMKYISAEEKFRKMALAEVEKFSKQPKKPQITDYRTALEAAGQTPKEDTINTANNFKNNEEGYTLFIPDEWKAIKNFTISGPLLKTTKGTYFTNMSKGAKFYIIRINEADSSESFVNLPFSNFVKGKYLVKYTEKKEAGNTLYLYFEISCSAKKFLLFFEVPKLVYEEYKASFESIINSFEINC